MLDKMSSCISFVAGGSTDMTPTMECCTGLASVIKDNVICICQLAGNPNSNSQAADLGIDPKRLMLARQACHISIPADNCAKLGYPIGTPVNATMSTPAPSPYGPARSKPPGVGDHLVSLAPATKPSGRRVQLVVILLSIPVGVVLLSLLTWAWCWRNTKRKTEIPRANMSKSEHDNYNHTYNVDQSDHDNFNLSSMPPTASPTITNSVSESSALYTKVTKSEHDNYNHNYNVEQSDHHNLNMPGLPPTTSPTIANSVSEGAAQYTKVCKSERDNNNHNYNVDQSDYDNFYMSRLPPTTSPSITNSASEGSATYTTVSKSEHESYNHNYNVDQNEDPLDDCDLPLFDFNAVAVATDYFSSPVREGSAPYTKIG